MDSAMPNLPDEIIVDILTRLPVLSLCKFRCVSKSWRSLISHPHFIRTHLDRNTKLKHESLILSYTRYLYSVELESLQFGDQAVAVLLNFPPDRDPIYCHLVYGSCDGLVLMLDRWLNCSVVNPSTREVRKLPETPFNVNDARRRFTDYGFGYDSSIDDYKIVSICDYNNAVCVYALKANSWRRIENYPYENSRFGRQSFVCGALHWVASNGTDDVIVALGLADEKFRTVPSPDCICGELCVLGGCLGMFAPQLGPYRLDVWVMKKYGVKDSWTKFTVTYRDSFQSWRPLSSSSSGQLLFETERSQLVVFDPWEKNARS